MNRNRLELLTIVFLLLFIAGSVYIVAGLAVGARINYMLVGGSTVAFFLFAVLHAGLTLGAGHMLVFLSISTIVSLVFELLGTARGWIYGSYHYTDRLGPKVLGLVPILIPLAWFMMMYASYALANDLAQAGRQRAESRWQPGTPQSRLLYLWLVFLSSAIMTSWDLMNDPVNVNGGHWVWDATGPYFGIPISNYLGWMLTTLVIFGLYRLYERLRPPQQAPALRPYFWTLPFIAFAVTMLSNVAVLILNNDPAPAMVGLFSMGAFLAAAVSRRVM
jgi:putative membrane protein